MGSANPLGVQKIAIVIKRINASPHLNVYIP